MIQFRAFWKRVDNAEGFGSDEIIGVDGHLTPFSVNAFRAHSLTKGNGELMVRHLLSCRTCFEKHLLSEEIDAAIGALGESLHGPDDTWPHIHEEQLRQAKANRLSSNEKGAIVDHLQTCPYCRHRAKEIGLHRDGTSMAGAATTDQPPRIRRLRAAAVIGSLGLAWLAIWTVWQARGRRIGPPTPIVQIPRIRPRPIPHPLGRQQIIDASGVALAVGTTPVFSGRSVDSDVTALLTPVLRGSRVVAPSRRKDVSNAGGLSSRTALLRQPVGELTGPTPLFIWTLPPNVPISGIKLQLVNIDQGHNFDPKTLPSGATSFSWPGSLKPGLYKWLIIVNPGDKLEKPIPSLYQRFRVLPVSLEKVKRKYADSDLVIGLADAAYGKKTEAVTRLSRVLAYQLTIHNEAGVKAIRSILQRINSPQDERRPEPSRSR